VNVFEKLILKLSKNLPESLKTILRPVYYSIFNPNKYYCEQIFWEGRFEKEKGCFKNSHYKKLMLAMAGESDEIFLKGKIIADFGCGPRGSLAWISSANLKIGIDVLADIYAEKFKSNIISHGMIYIKSTESVIPIPSNYIDIVFTINAMDHVDNFGEICGEIIRILKPGGEFIGSFNLNEPETPCEPQRLTEDSIKESLLDCLEIKSYRITNYNSGEDPYVRLIEGKANYQKGHRGVLWVRAKKPDLDC